MREVFSNDDGTDVTQIDVDCFKNRQSQMIFRAGTMEMLVKTCNLIYKISCFLRHKHFILDCREWLGVSLFIYLFICWTVEWEYSCFATTLLHHVPPKVTSVLVLFVIFGGLL